MHRFASLLTCAVLLTAMGCCCGRGYNACYAPGGCPGGACNVGAPIGSAPGGYPSASFYNSYSPATASAPISVSPSPVAMQPGIAYPTTATAPITYSTTATAPIPYSTTASAPMVYPTTAAAPVQSLPTY
jgi:hypothetical protein